MRIGIDARLSGKKHAGIGRYIENLLIRLPLLKPNVEWVYFFHDKSQLAELMQIFGQLKPKPSVGVSDFFKNIEVIYVPIQHYSLAEQTQLPAIFRAANLDLLHVPHFNLPIFYRGPYVLTIHDLLWHEKRGLNVTTLSPFQYHFKHWAYKFISGRAIKKAAHIFVPTQTVKKTLLSYYPAWKKRLKQLSVTPEGFYRTNPVRLSPELSQKLVGVKDFILYVGSLYPHKNIGVVLKAMQKTNFPPQCTLVLVGTRDVFLDQVKKRVAELGLNKKVIFSGFVSDEQLVALYRQAWALVQPSFSEGFGLTGLEAMSAGTAVLASDIEIFKEVYGSAAEFFDPTDEADFINHLINLTVTRRAKLIRLGQEQMQKYDWQKMTTQTILGYEQALARQS